MEIFISQHKDPYGSLPISMECHKGSNERCSNAFFSDVTTPMVEYCT